VTDRDLNQAAQKAWNANAEWWDGQVGAEGNAFHRTLIAPAQMELLALKPGERVLEIACGNGQFAREMARAGARVLATDFSEPFLERARQHTAESGLKGIEFRRLDATSEEQLLSLGAHAFDAAVCTMALMDMADIGPLLRSLPQLLRPGGRFVFSVMHPCFNHNGAHFLLEEEDREGELIETYALKIVDYLEPKVRRGLGIIGQPVASWYFHRPLHELLGVCFDAGLVMDGLREPAFPPGSPAGRPLAWANFSAIPPVLVCRLRVAG